MPKKRKRAVKATEPAEADTPALGGWAAAFSDDDSGWAAAGGSGAGAVAGAPQDDTDSYWGPDLSTVQGDGARLSANTSSAVASSSNALTSGRSGRTQSASGRPRRGAGATESTAAGRAASAVRAVSQKCRSLRIPVVSQNGH